MSLNLDAREIIKRAMYEILFKFLMEWVMHQKSYHEGNDLLFSQFTFMVTEEKTRKIGFIILATDNVAIILPECDETWIDKYNENIPLFSY